MLALLTAVVEEGTGTRAALEGFAAGKTGTSQDHRDGWFVGFNHELVVGVWVGNDDNSPTKEVTGGGLPAEIWKNFMTEASGLAPVEVAATEPAPEEPPAAEEQGSADPSVGNLEEIESGEEQEPAPPPEDVAAREEADPEEQATPQPASSARARAQRPQLQEAEEAQPRRRQAAHEEPEAEPPATRRADPESELARNRARAEEFAARQRAAGGRSPGVEGPSILLGGRGIQLRGPAPPAVARLGGSQALQATRPRRSFVGSIDPRDRVRGTEGR
jgi:membrane peptidoglycan carboxypeptidase